MQTYGGFKGAKGAKLWAPGALGAPVFLAPIEWRLRPGALFLLVWRLFAFALENGWRPGRQGARAPSPAPMPTSVSVITA